MKSTNGALKNLLLVAASAEGDFHICSNINNTYFSGAAVEPWLVISDGERDDGELLASSTADLSKNKFVPIKIPNIFLFFHEIKLQMSLLPQLLEHHGVK